MEENSPRTSMIVMNFENNEVRRSYVGPCAFDAQGCASLRDDAPANSTNKHHQAADMYRYFLCSLPFSFLFLFSAHHPSRLLLFSISYPSINHKLLGLRVQFAPVRYTSHVAQRYGVRVSLTCPIQCM